jgi:hypothetical protein
MKTIEDLIYQLKHQDYGSNSTIIELAIEKVARNRQFFSGLLNRNDGWEAIAKDIYEWLVVRHEDLQRMKKITWKSSNTVPPWEGEELPLIMAPLHDEVRKAWMEQAVNIGAAIGHAVESLEDKIQSQGDTKTKINGIEESHGLSLDRVGKRFGVDGEWFSELPKRLFEMLETIWKNGRSWTKPNDIDVYAHQLKSKLPDKIRDEIETRTNLGYRFKRFEQD